MEVKLIREDADGLHHYTASYDDGLILNFATYEDIKEVDVRTMLESLHDIKWKSYTKAELIKRGHYK